MATQPLVRRLHQNRKSIASLLTPGKTAASVAGQGGSLLSGAAAIGGFKYRSAARQMRILNPARLGSLTPGILQRPLLSPMLSAADLLHLKPGEKQAGWSQVEIVYPTAAAAEPEPPPQPGEMRAGSIIPPMPTFPKPGQSLESFKEQVQQRPKPAARPEVDPARPRIAPNARLFSRVQEISTSKEEPNPPEPPDEIQRQPDRAPSPRPEISLQPQSPAPKETPLPSPHQPAAPREPVSAPALKAPVTPPDTGVAPQPSPPETSQLALTAASRQPPSQPVLPAPSRPPTSPPVELPPSAPAAALPTPSPQPAPPGTQPSVIPPALAGEHGEPGQLPMPVIAPQPSPARIVTPNLDAQPGKPVIPQLVQPLQAPPAPVSSLSSPAEPAPAILPPLPSPAAVTGPEISAPAAQDRLTDPPKLAGAVPLSEAEPVQQIKPVVPAPEKQPLAVAQPLEPTPTAAPAKTALPQAVPAPRAMPVEKPAARPALPPARPSAASRPALASMPAPKSSQAAARAASPAPRGTPAPSRAGSPGVVQRAPEPSHPETSTPPQPPAAPPVQPDPPANLAAPAHPITPPGFPHPAPGGPSPQLRIGNEIPVGEQPLAPASDAPTRAALPASPAALEASSPDAPPPSMPSLALPLRRKVVDRITSAAEVKPRLAQDAQPGRALIPPHKYKPTAPQSASAPERGISRQPEQPPFSPPSKPVEIERPVLDLPLAGFAPGSPVPAHPVGQNTFSAAAEFLPAGPPLAGHSPSPARPFQPPATPARQQPPPPPALESANPSPAPSSPSTAAPNASAAVSNTQSHNVVQRLWEEHQGGEGDGAQGSAAAAAGAPAQPQLDLARIAEDVLPYVKRLIELESDRISSRYR